MSDIVIAHIPYIYCRSVCCRAPLSLPDWHCISCGKEIMHIHEYYNMEDSVDPPDEWSDLLEIMKP